MVFCGQCGYQLPPGETRCPRCGSLAEASTIPASTVPNYDPDAPTAEARSLNTRLPSPAETQQKLVLRPSEPDYNTQPVNEETTRAATQSPGAGAPRAAPTTQAPYPGPAPQRSPVYPQQDTSYPAYRQEQPADYAGQYPPARRRSSAGRTVALLIILLGLLLMASAMALFALHRGNVGNTNSGNVPTTTTTATSSTPSANVPPQALAVIQQYYSDINRHDYRAAYNLWKNNTQNFIAFRNGFKNTVRDQVILGSATVRADNTVRIPVTVNATENTAAGIKHTVYQGSYIVGQQPDGSWQIFSGYLTAV